MEDKSVVDATPSGSALSIPNGSANGGQQGEVTDSPTSPSSPNALARFEFETGRGNEGSKILMVQWYPSYDDGRELTPEDLKGWQVTWDGKSAPYGLNDDEKDPEPLLRIYFLLRENDPIPASVTISHATKGRTLQTKCMPAIFTTGLGASQPDSGLRGVLHTIWAKKRLSQLQEEIRKELQDNSEGVALEMALQEQSWVIEHFGLPDPYAHENPAPPPTPLSPQTPRSPVGGRLGEKLRGLKLSTSPADLVSTPSATPRTTFQPFLSSSLNTVSVPSLGIPMPKAGTAPAVASLDAMIDNSQPIAPVSQSKDTEDDLFALPMSPRSPEMKASPFSLLR
ncbi:hypothetical protein GGR57DRAFT_173780 [Xylariaceae sp. FL1272]|nr:hypothetical protein GGR57DRAFT_173780 [Xylariaceae sp. FL1272]